MEDLTYNTNDKSKWRDCDLTVLTQSILLAARWAVPVISKLGVSYTNHLCSKAKNRRQAWLMQCRSYSVLFCITVEVMQRNWRLLILALPHGFWCLSQFICSQLAVLFHIPLAGGTEWVVLGWNVPAVCWGRVNGFLHQGTSVSVMMIFSFQSYIHGTSALTSSVGLCTAGHTVVTHLGHGRKEFSKVWVVSSPSFV